MIDTAACEYFGIDLLEAGSVELPALLVAVENGQEGKASQPRSPDQKRIREKRVDNKIDGFRTSTHPTSLQIQKAQARRKET